MEQWHQQSQRDKEKNLAWFKLADLIARGEREKALSVFRLLAHSLPDRAYVLQIEGDILWYFDDGNFIEKYKQAAFLYQKEKRWIDAIMLYENVLAHNPDSIDILMTLSVYYAVVDWEERFDVSFRQLVDLLQKNKCDIVHFKRLMNDLNNLAKGGEGRAKKVWLAQLLTTISQTLPHEITKE